MPRIIYKNALGKRIPSVTTVIHANLGWGSEPLHYYWWKQGIYLATKTIFDEIKNSDYGILYAADPIEYAEGIRTSVNWRKPLQTAAQIGTAAHEMVECYQKGNEFDYKKYELTEEEWEQANRCYSAWLKWAEQSALKVIGSEISLKSEIHQFGGTLDGYVAEVNGELSILDIKTSDGIYDTHKIQLSAYGKLFEENNPTKKIKRYHIIQIKKAGSFAHHSWDASAFETCWEVFLMLKRMHSYQAAIKKL